MGKALLSGVVVDVVSLLVSIADFGSVLVVVVDVVSLCV